MENSTIRQFELRDQQSVRTIACDTAFIGKPCEAFFQSREILADFLTLYFTQYEPESCFIAEVNGQVVGHILGARDTKIIAKIFIKKILPLLLFKFLFSGALLNNQNLKILFYLFLSFLRGEFKAPSFYKDYPATLHINLKQGFRKAGIGSKLIATYLDYLNKQEVRGVYLATISEEAKIFFEKNEFNLIFKAQRSYFRHILNKDITCYIYAKKL
jgi:GNAT superfamily N-acetyltransferase